MFVSSHHLVFALSRAHSTSPLPTRECATTTNRSKTPRRYVDDHHISSLPQMAGVVFANFYLNIRTPSSSSSTPLLRSGGTSRLGSKSTGFLTGFPLRFRFISSGYRPGSGDCVIECSDKNKFDKVPGEKVDRVPFDINVAVVLAGFAFEAYTSPAKDVGWCEVDAAGCETTFLSEMFFCEIYDGQLLLKLKRGSDFLAMDPWGTSDPYVILQLEGQIVRSNTKWATKEPVWNEDFTLNCRKSTSMLLQVAAWDANLVTPHKRMGNAGVDLAPLCDGNLHELVIELEGLGGAGKIELEVALWRDSSRRRLIVAFRGTEQVRWKDLRTDLMLAPSGLNPERLGSDLKDEVQVHSGFLTAYDSVRNRIMNLIKHSINFCSEEDNFEILQKWQVYVTGHSLGGALATLLALELSSSRMAKSGAISVTMYNFGSPRVGNRRFAEVYNEKVKDSWRIVNHRDIIPTVPRLIGYCHVAQPVYLLAGDLRDALENIELSEDGYQGDVIGEHTPDSLVNEFFKGEKELIEKILQTEINLFRSIRDGTALMQHMEDFYYIMLLEGCPWSMPGPAPL